MPNLKLMLSRRSVTEDQFRQAIAESFSISECLSKIGQHPSGSNYRWIKMMITELKIDTSHLLGQARRRTMKRTWVGHERPLDEVLIENSDYISTSSLKAKLWKYELLPRCCDECGLGELWNESPISLQLDHINGNPRDNRIENLRILCPNCHSQTKTWAGRNQKN